MNFVTSKDGTKIAYEHQGSGPVLILVGGGLDDGSENRQHMPELAKYFTVYNYARRGRGESGDTQPYALAREIEDIEALIAEAGSPAYLFGASSGGALVLEAVMAGVNVDKLAVYEVPYSVEDYMIAAWQDYRKQLDVALAADDRDQALALFMRLAGSSDEGIEGAKHSEYWPGMLKVAPTLAYDAACLGDRQEVPVERLAAITQPTLVLTGTVMAEEMGELQPSFFADAAKLVADSIPHAEHKALEGQSHIVDSKTLAVALNEFFN